MMMLAAMGFYVCLMAWYAMKWCSLKQSSLVDSSAYFSIIIPARNESKNIEALLNTVQLINYNEDQFEIIVVDDHSTDNTVEIVRGYLNSVPNLKLLRLPGSSGSKKAALAFGINHAKGKLIITTDADCKLPPDHLGAVSSEYKRNGSLMIIAPVVIRPKESFISLFQCLDFLALQAVTITGAHKLCNGANLVFKKEAFLEVNGYEGINDIASGDDVLLLDKFSKKYPGAISVLKNKKAIVETAPVSNWRDFIQQRARWSGKWQKLPSKDVLILSLVFVTNMLLLIMFIVSLFVPVIEIFNARINSFVFWLGVIGIKCCSEMFLMIPASKFFGLTKFMVWFPIMQPVHIIFTSISGLFGLKGNYTWKDRAHK